MSRNVSALLNQENTLSDMNNEAVIQILDLDGNTGTGMQLDDIVEYLDLDSFNKTTTVEPVGINNIQGHQFHADNALGAHQAPVPHVISYIDFSPPEIYNSPNHVSKSCLTLPESPQDIIEVVPIPLVEPQVARSVEKQNSRKPAGGGKSPRCKREQKVKLHQCEEPFSDPVKEKKRQNAINAKKNRDKQKNRLQDLENLVKSLTTERNSLQATNTKLVNKCDAFEKQLMTVCKQFNVPVIILPQD